MRYFLLQGQRALAVLTAAAWTLMAPVQCANCQGQGSAGQQHKEAPAARVDLYGDPLPDGALVRLGTIRYCHIGLHESALFIPNSRTFVVKERGAGVKFYEARTGKLIDAIQGLDLLDFALSADGKTLATLAVSFRPQPRRWHMQLALWDTAKAERKSTIDWDEPWPSMLLALAPDGLVIATASASGTVRLWDVTSGRELLRFSVVQRHEIEDIAFSPGGDALAVAAGQGVFLWRWQLGERPQKLAGMVGGANCVAFSPDGKWLAAAGGRWPMHLNLFDAATGRLVRQRKLPQDQTLVHVLAFDSSSRLVAVATESRVEFWNAATGDLVRSVEHEREMVDHALAPDGSYRTGIQVNRCVKHRAIPARIRFTRDGKTVVTGGGFSPEADILFWDADSGRPLRALGHPKWIGAWEISPDGKYLASTSFGPDDDAVWLWETKTGKHIYKLYGHGKGGGGAELAFAPDGKTFASFGSDMFLRTWDVRTGKALTEHAIRPSGMEIRVDEEGNIVRSHDPFAEDEISTAIGRAVFTADARLLLVPHRGELYVFDVQSGKELRRFEPVGGGFHDFALSPDGKLLVTVSASESQTAETNEPAQDVSDLRLIDFESNTLIGHHKLNGWYNTFVKPRFSRDGRLVAIGGYGAGHGRDDGYDRSVSVCVWDVVADREYARVPTDFTAFGFSPDSSRIAIGRNNGNVLIWDLRRFRPKQ